MQRTTCHSASLFEILKNRVVQFFSVLLVTQAVFCAEDSGKVHYREPGVGAQIVGQKPTSGLVKESLASKPLTPPPYLRSLESTNEFDRLRQLWPDRAPPPLPPPPPPLPSPLTEQDVQLYGVVIVGQTKRATVKFGPRFSSLNATGKLFTTISEGQVIGEYTLTGIKPTHLVLTAPGGQQQLSFNKKTDRPVGGSPVAPALAGANDVDATGGGSQQQPTSTVDASGKLPPPGAPTSVASTPAVSSDSALKNPAPGSLAAAIVAAQAAAQNPASQAQNAPSPANFNPFLQLLPKQ